MGRERKLNGDEIHAILKLNGERYSVIIEIGKIVIESCKVMVNLLKDLDNYGKMQSGVQQLGINMLLYASKSILTAR